MADFGSRPPSRPPHRYNGPGGFPSAPQPGRNFARPGPPPLRRGDAGEVHGRMTPIKHEGKLPWVQLRNAVFHPAIFQKMIGRIDPKARNGDLVAVYDRDGTPFGSGMLSMKSQIGLRMLTFDPAPVDESIILERLATAVRLRKELLGLDAVSNAYRVVHAEGDGLPGLIVDRFESYAVVELFNFPMWRRIEVIKEELKMLLDVKEVLVRADERVQTNEGFSLAGDDDAPLGPREKRSADRKSVVITENGVRFQIDLTHGHKTGFFCDQRENRKMLTDYTAGEDVLDLCSYSGGFGVYAAALGKAASVKCVDLDEDAIALATRNANLNKIPKSVFSTVHNDVFAYVREMVQAGSPKKFGVVILDPPKLIASREEFDEGRAKYFDMNKLVLNVVKPGGIFVTCSCSGLLSPEDFFQMVRGAARGAGRRVQVLRGTGPGPDHPVMTDCPESAYLKCLWCKVW